MHLLFPSFFDRPTRMRFADQEEDEVIELLLRQHWVTNIPWIFITILLLLVPFIAAWYIPFSGISIPPDLPLFIIPATLTLWYLFVTVYVIENFLHWYFNIYIVTNLHLVDVNFDSLLHRDILEAGIENVESASSKIGGIIRSLFNYGDVFVETAAKEQVITFNAVPYPDRVVDRINDLKRLMKERLEE